MKRILATVCLLLAIPAGAGYDAGLAAEQAGVNLRGEVEVDGLAFLSSDPTEAAAILTPKIHLCRLIHTN